jgi:hypothetical protein
MTWEHDVAKVEMLRQAFVESGFDLSQPALVGYPLDGKIQLVSGTHRHLAAKQAGIVLPITLWLRGDIEEMWGTELWPDVIRDIPVRLLQNWAITDGPKRSPYSAVELPSHKGSAQ